MYIGHVFKPKDIFHREENTLSFWAKHVFFTFSTAFAGQSGAKAAHTPNLLWFHRIAQKKKELRMEKKVAQGFSYIIRIWQMWSWRRKNPCFLVPRNSLRLLRFRRNDVSPARGTQPKKGRHVVQFLWAKLHVEQRGRMPEPWARAHELYGTLCVGFFENRNVDHQIWPWTMGNAHFFQVEEVRLHQVDLEFWDSCADAMSVDDSTTC